MRQTFAFRILLTLSLGAVAICGFDLAAAAGDPAIGAAVFVRECALCHTIGKASRTVSDQICSGLRSGRPGPGYRYSPEFTTIATWTWSPDGIASFVVAPGLTIPGNKMSVFQGVAESELDDLIAYVAAQK